MSEFLHSQLNIIPSELFSAIFPHILNRNFNQHFGLVFNMRHHDGKIALLEGLAHPLPFNEGGNEVSIGHIFHFDLL